MKRTVFLHIPENSPNLAIIIYEFNGKEISFKSYVESFSNSLVKNFVRVNLMHGAKRLQNVFCHKFKQDLVSFGVYSRTFKWIRASV